MKIKTWNEWQKYFSAYRNGLQSEGASIVEDYIAYALSFETLGTEPQQVISKSWTIYKNANLNQS
jgi:hypothetical protein